MVNFHCRVNLLAYRRKFSWLYVRKKNKKRRMNGLRKRKKLSVVQLFAFTHAAHTSLLILFTYVKPAKFTSVRT